MTEPVRKGNSCRLCNVNANADVAASIMQTAVPLEIQCHAPRKGTSWTEDPSFSIGWVCPINHPSIHHPTIHRPKEEGRETLGKGVSHFKPRRSATTSPFRVAFST